jgi:hypothetical protein
MQQLASSNAALGAALTVAVPAAVHPTCNSPNTQVSRRSYQLLLAHMTRFVYSPTGALKWKKDVNEYAEVLASFGVPSASEDMGHLLQLVNVLVVAPDSLLGLVNGSLRMAHRCVHLGVEDLVLTCTVTCGSSGW